MDYNNLNFDVDDLLNRKVFVKNLMQVINEWNQHKHENDSLVIAVDASWGSGKSYLLNMWKNWLISKEENFKENYFVSYYNAWDNDDFDGAFIPLIYKLQEMNVYQEDSMLIEDLKQRSISFLKSCGVAILKDSIKKTIGNETADLICSGIDGATEKEAEDYFEEYKKFIDEKEKFRNALINFVPDNGKLIVFVDELDRCRPTFAVETLEIVKHYFNIHNIVFIFAVDLEQLSHSIATMYGEGMDSTGYLRRFFDVNINIPSGDIKQYVNIRLRDFFNNRGYSESLIDIVANLYIELKLSLRDIDKITNNFIILCLFYKHLIEEKSTSQPNEIVNILEIYLYFLTLKYKYPSIYKGILKHKFMTYDNSPKEGWFILEKEYSTISPNIREMLKKSQTGNAQKIDASLTQEYGLDKINSEGVSFAEHIERTLEMFS